MEAEKLVFKDQITRALMVESMAKNFEKIKVNSSGPDGIHPILSKKVPSHYHRTKIVSQALDKVDLFDTRLTLIKKKGKGYRPI